MAGLVPVEHDPFADDAAPPPSPSLEPVDHDPFAIGNPMGEVYPPQGGNAVRQAGSSLASGVADWAMTPGRAYKEGLSPDEETEWGAGTALGMIGAPGTVGGVPGVGSGLTKGIRAYHGSPHDFDRFDLSKIGTGEGAQAYGHGMYFAENEGVAKSYRDSLAPKTSAYEGREYPKNSIRGYAIQDYESLGKEGAIKNLENSIAHYTHYNPDTAELYRDALDFVKNIDPEKMRVDKGKMYEVDINAHPDQFLDWDKPLREQPIAETVRGLVPQDIRKSFDYNVDKGNIPGSNAYFNYVPSQSFPIRDTPSSPWRASGANSYEDALALVGGDPKRVNRLLTPDKAGSSDRFREAGIPGIKYLDQGSRGVSPVNLSRYENKVADLQAKAAANPKDDGVMSRLSDAQQELESMKRANAERTSNYVLFDDKLVSILRKYGLAGLAALPPAAAAEYKDRLVPVDHDPFE